MKPLAFLLASTFVALSACHSDDVPNKSPLIQINFGYYLTDNASGYIVVTDLKGNTLAKATIQNQQNITVTPTNGFNEDAINVYLIVQVNPYYHTSAYLNLQRGSSWNLSAQPVKGNFHDPVRLKLKNLPTTFDYLTLGTNAFGYTSPYSLDTLGYGTQFNYFVPGKAFAQVVTNGEGKFNIFNTDDSKTTLDIDFNTLTKTSLKKSISIPSGFFGHYQLTGNPDDSTDETYFLFDTGVYIDRSVFPIYYLDLPMKRYHTSLSLTAIGSNKTFGYENWGDIITHYDLLNMDASVATGSASAFEANFTGDFDFYNAEYRDATNTSFIHVYSSKKVSTFQIPDFSKEFPVPPISFSDMKLTTLSLTDVGDWAEDQSYFKYYSTIPHGTPSLERSVVFRYQ